MGGFGSGSFGSDPFGAWAWSRFVLWEQIPEVYRLQDPNYGNHFQKLIYGYRRQYERIRSKIVNLENIRDPFAVRTQYDETWVLRLGTKVETKGTILQRGQDGTVDASRRFVAESARFRIDDVGSELSFLDSATPANNKSVLISQVVDSHTVVTDPSFDTDAVKARWEMREYLEDTSGVVTVQVREGYANAIYPGWILFDGFADFEVLGRRLFPITTDSRNLFTEVEGSDGYIDTSNRLVVTSEFRATDVGKKVAIRGLADPSMDGFYEVTLVEGSGPWELTLDEALPIDQGPLFWARYPFAELDLGFIGDPPKGIVEQEGVDLQVDVLPDNEIITVSGRFTPGVVGQEIRILGSTLGNDGAYTVTEYVSTTQLKVTPALTADETDLTWRLRSKSNYGDGSQVEVRAPSMIKEFVKDFGIEIDAQESEQLQRWQAHHVPHWIRYKGHTDGYRILGLLTGVNVTVTQLYRVASNWYEALINAGVGATVLVGDTDPGRTGTDGALTTVVGRLHFEADTALFKASDVGLNVSINNASNPTNNKLYTIAEVLSATEVKFDVTDTAITPDYGVGGISAIPTLRWAIVRLYANVLNLLPHYDDFDSDLMVAIIDYLGGEFSVDRFCWEDIDTDVPVDLISVAFVSEGIWLVTVETPAGQPGSADVITAVGYWVFYDTDGTQYYVETVPVDIGGGQFTFEVHAVSAPVTGGSEDPYLKYLCQSEISCDWCPSYRMLAEIELGPELAGQTGIEVENIFERAVERLQQVKPRHVEMISRFVQTITTSNLTLSATVETP